MLEVKHLELEFYDHDQPEKVIHDLNFHMDAGEILGIVGESGSGKTQTALSIAGLLSRHDLKKEGEIHFEGLNLLTCKRSELRKLQGNEIGMVFQEPMTSLNPVKKIGWQVEEALVIHDELSKEERKKKVLKALEDVELDNPEEIYDMYPHQLSGGMRQRVMIAAAMIMEPKLLIADEPTTALDVVVQAQLMKLFLKLNRTKKMGILFISHDLGLISKICTRVLVMKDGKLVESGSVEDIFENSKEEYTKDLIDSIPKCDFL